jgi:hypothetical protein
VPYTGWMTSRQTVQSLKMPATEQPEGVYTNEYLGILYPLCKLSITTVVVSGYC